MDDTGSETEPKSETDSETESKSGSKSGSSIWIWILIIVIIIVIIIAIVFIFKGNSNDTSPPGNGNPTGGNPTGDGSLTSACTQNSDCDSNNCSFGFCQTAGNVTRTVGASCIASNTSVAVAGCVSGLSCIRPSGQTIGVCTDGTSNFFTACFSGLNQCRSYNVCKAPIGVNSTTNTFCVFMSNPNICPSGKCLPGYTCDFTNDNAAGNCLASNGLSCIMNSQCESQTCSGPGISIWNGSAWSGLAQIQTGINIDRLEASSSGNGDDLWALDINNGLYHLPNGKQQFNQVLSNTTQRTINGNKKTLDILNFGVANNVPYVLYSAKGSGATLYPIFEVDVTTSPATLNPFRTSNGVQIDSDGNNFTQIVDIDVITSNNQINMVINGKAGSGSSSNFNQYVSSNKGKFKKAVDVNGSPIILTSNNIVRFAPNSNLSVANQALNINQLQNVPNFSYMGITCLNCVAFAGQSAQNFTENSGVAISNNTIIDYSMNEVGSGNSATNNIYLVAKVNNQYNLYVAPANFFNTQGINQYLGSISILPGYYDSNTRIATNGFNLYLYSKTTCAGSGGTSSST